MKRTEQLSQVLSVLSAFLLDLMRSRSCVVAIIQVPLTAYVQVTTPVFSLLPAFHGCKEQVSDYRLAADQLVLFQSAVDRDGMKAD